MSGNGEFEKKRTFIVSQQAKFATGMRDLRKAQAETKQVIARNREIVARLADMLLECSRNINAKIVKFASRPAAH